MIQREKYRQIINIQTNFIINKTCQQNKDENNYGSQSLNFTYGTYAYGIFKEEHKL